MDENELNRREREAIAVLVEWVNANPARTPTGTVVQLSNGEPLAMRTLNVLSTIRNRTAYLDALEASTPLRR